MATYDLTKEIPAAEDLLADDILNCTYTGSEITLELAAGKYKLECYGAAGTTNGRYTSLLGGEGGYSYGSLSLDAVTRIYLNAGGMGTTSTSSSTKNSGGYNGGGYSYYYAGPGGGATHIATASGLLSTLSSSTDSIIIVAGGGGGSAAYSSSSSSTYQGKGGKGGGESGEAGYYGSSNTSSNALKYAGQGGTQTAGGAAGTQTSRQGSAGSFGLGGNGGSASSSYYGEGGGGGGYYGGGGASGYEAGGGGGSGYLSSSLTDSATSQGGNDSTGYIIITVLEIYSKTHKITFYDGTTEIGSVETEGEETITLPTAPTKTGYKFLGYYLADGTTQITETSYATTKLTEDVVCFAKYRKYEISFYIDSTLLSTVSTTGKEAITFPTAEKEGCKFLNWQINGTSTTLDQDYLDTHYLTADIKADAIFQTLYTIYFICDGTTYKTHQTTGKEEVAVPETVPSKSGYIFDGWYLDENFETPYTLDYFKNIELDKDYTIYGKLEEEVPDEPTLASNVNFYVRGSLYATISTKGKETLTLPLSPSISGYTFDGWYFDEAYSLPFTESSLADRWINKDLSIYAKLTEIPKFLISFLINGRTYYSYKSAGKETLKQPSTPKLTDYDFEGWYWDEEFSDPFDADKYISTQITEPIFVYGNAVYTKKNTINFYSSTAATTTYATITTTGKEALELPQDPDADLGYEFDNWYLDKKFQNAFDIAYYQEHYLTSSINVYANFKASSTGPYSLTITKDGEGNVDPDEGTHSIAKGTTTTITVTPTTLPFRYLEIDGEAVEATETEIITPSSACAYFDFNTDASDILGRSTTSTSGTPSIDTSTVKFGAGSIYFDGTAALGITLPDSFSDEFTVEFWFYTSSTATSGIYPTLFSTNTDNEYGGVYCAVDDGSYGDSMICRANAAGSSGNNGATGSECDKSVWNHFCFCRSGTNNYYFLNGTLMATVTQSTPITVNMICLGGLLRSSSMSSIISSDYLTGYIDDLLISNTCKHTADFTIPTEAYNATKTSTYSYDIENQSANVNAIVHFGELENFTLTSSAADGTISPSGETTIKEGNSQEFTCYGTSGQTLKALLINGVAVETTQSGTTYSYTLKNIHSDKTIKAVFSPLLYWKTNGKWFGVSKVFKKVNGVWVEQESDTLSTLFSTTENYIGGRNDD